jgi:hypothetical protein
MSAAVDGEGIEKDARASGGNGVSPTANQAFPGCWPAFDGVLSLAMKRVFTSSRLPRFNR